MAVDELAVDEGATVLEALRAIDRGTIGLCLVVDGASPTSFVGVLTDGDIRRALIGGCGLDAPIVEMVNRQPVCVSPEERRPHVLELMHARRLAAVPIVHGNSVVGVHTIRELIGGQARRNPVVIMAGGRGRRLGDLTTEVPKPMLDVAGRPILERLILHLVGEGFSAINISVNYRAEVIEDHFGDGSEFGCEIRYLREGTDEPLGTAGSLALLDRGPATPSSPVLVLNGDLITTASLGRLVDLHDAQEAAVTIGATTYRHEIPFGVLKTDGHRLWGVEEKPTLTWSVSAGIHVLRPDVIDLVPTNTFFDMTDLVDAALSRGLEVTTIDLEESWMDVGRPTELARARGMESL